MKLSLTDRAGLCIIILAVLEILVVVGLIWW